MASCPTCGTQEVPGQQFCASCGSPTSSVYSTPRPVHRGRVLPFGYTCGILATIPRFFHRRHPVVDHRVATLGATTSLRHRRHWVTAITFLYNSLLIGLRRADDRHASRFGPVR